MDKEINFVEQFKAISVPENLQRMNAKDVYISDRKSDTSLQELFTMMPKDKRYIVLKRKYKAARARKNNL